MIRHIYDVAEACSDRVVVVTPWPERYRASLPAGCTFVEEVTQKISLPIAAASAHEDSLHPLGSQGPLVGFLQGLAAVGSDWALVLACDLPRLHISTLQAWSQQLESLPEQTIALLPKTEGRWEPLCGFYRCSCQASLADFVEAGGRSFQQWLRYQEVHPISVTDEQIAMLYNCNTPEDWNRIYRGCAEPWGVTDVGL